MLRQTVGVCSLSKAIGLLSKDDCFDVDEKVLIKHLCEQFEATPAKAMRSIEEAVEIGIIVRVRMGNDYYVIRMVCNPDLYVPKVVRVRRDVLSRELGGRFGISPKKAERMIQSLIGAGMLEESKSDGRKLLRFKK